MRIATDIFLGAMVLAGCITFGHQVGIAAEIAGTDPGRAPTGVVASQGDLVKEADGTELRMAYFPSLDRLRMLVLHAPRQFTRWEAKLTAVADGKTFAEYHGPLPMPASGQTLTAPAIEDGVYAVGVSLIAPDGACTANSAGSSSENGSSGNGRRWDAIGW